MLPTKRARPEYRLDAERERAALNNAKRASMVTAPIDAARRHGKEVEYKALFDHELPQLQQDLNKVKHMLRNTDTQRMGDLDLFLYT